MAYCPQCKAPMDQEDLSCPRCGYDFPGLPRESPEPRVVKWWSRPSPVYGGIPALLLGFVTVGEFVADEYRPILGLPSRAIPLISGLLVFAGTWMLFAVYALRRRQKMDRN